MALHVKTFERKSLSKDCRAIRIAPHTADVDYPTSGTSLYVNDDESKSDEEVRAVVAIAAVVIDCLYDYRRRRRQIRYRYQIRIQTDRYQLTVVDVIVDDAD